MEYLTSVNEQLDNDRDFFEFLDNASEKILSSIIKNGIHTLMKIRRRNIEDELEQKILEKLLRPPISGKPGEKFELREVMHEETINGNILDKESMMFRSGINDKIAGELADHGYYRLMPDIPVQESLESWYHSEALDFQGVPFKSIMIFTIIKYSTRVDNGDDPKYKDIEHQKLQEYLDIHPELTNLWSAPAVDRNPPLFDLIESMS